MHSFLKQSTASQSRSIGPFLDDTDFKTAETGLTIANTDIKLMINGAASANKNSGGGTHRANGVYGLTFDATDTATVGEVFVSVVVAGALPVFGTFVVLEEAIYDALFAASANAYTGAAGSTVARADLINIAGAAVSTTTAQLGVNAVQISGDGTAADNLETAFDDTAGSVPWQGVVDQGTAQSATGTTLVLRSAAAFTDDQLIGATIFITGGSAGVGERRLITDYVSATDTATVDAWNTTPTGTITYKIIATAPSSGGSAPSAATVAAAVWDLATSGHTTSGTFGEQVKTDIDAIQTKTDFLPSATAGASGGILISGSNSGTTTLGALTVTGATTLTGAVTGSNASNNLRINGVAPGAAGGLFIAGTNAATTITTGLTTTFTGNLTGSVASVSGAVGSVTGAVGSVTGLTASDVGAIKTKTDSLTYTVANVLDANIQRVNDVAIVGDGSGTPWGP